MTENGRSFGELSLRKCAENEAFVQTLELHGERVLVPVRSGTCEALLYPAVGEGAAPTIFEIYGGCFSQGNVANNERMRMRMRDSTNFNVIGLDYRKSPNSPYPCGLEDLFDAVCYFVENARQYNIDTDRIATWGHSAGGNFACVLAMMGEKTRKYHVRAMLLDYPYLDAWKPGIEKTTSATGLTADVLDAMNEIYAPLSMRKDAHISPVYASDDVIAQLPPAAFVICGVDPLNAEAEDMVRRMVHLGREVLVRKFMRASHGFLEHWFFREYYMDALSPEERAGLPDDIGEQAEMGLAFVIRAAKYFLQAQ